MVPIVIRKAYQNDSPIISEIIRQAYLGNLWKMFIAALFNEITFQTTVFIAAFMFIFLGFPLQKCIFSVPFVLVMFYVLLYGSLLMKAAELIHNKRALECWVAEIYEPYFSIKQPTKDSYRIIAENSKECEELCAGSYQKRIVGTCAVMKHNLLEDSCWLFRLAVDERYRKNGIGLALVRAAQHWSTNHNYNSIELVTTECQEEARRIFFTAGFGIRQMYVKKLLTSAFKLQMFQLRCELQCHNA